MPASTPSERHGGAPRTLIVFIMGAAIVGAAALKDDIVVPLALWMAALFVTVRHGWPRSRHSVPGGYGR